MRLRKNKIVPPYFYYDLSAKDIGGVEDELQSAETPLLNGEDQRDNGSDVDPSIFGLAPTNGDIVEDVDPSIFGLAPTNGDDLTTTIERPVRPEYPDIVDVPTKPLYVPEIPTDQDDVKIGISGGGGSSKSTGARANGRQTAEDDKNGEVEGNKKGLIKNVLLVGALLFVGYLAFGKNKKLLK